MARGGGLKKGLTLGLAVGVGVAVARAAKARRQLQPATATPPSWPPLPPALAHEPPPEATAVVPGTAVPETLVAEAAVLEAAGVTEVAEVDEAAVQASRAAAPSAPAPDEALAWGPATGEVPRLDEAKWAGAMLDDLDLHTAGGGARPAPERADRPPPGPPAPPGDLDAVILAEEAALEADRLEAERLELTRLERERLQDEEDVAARARREQEREDALARFARQREEAQALLALQEEREARAAEGRWEVGDRPPMMAGDLDRDEEEWPELGSDAAPPSDEAHEPAEAGGGAVDVEDEQLAALEPLVPDDAVADLDEEPAWGAAGARFEEDRFDFDEPAGRPGPDDLEALEDVEGLGGREDPAEALQPAGEPGAGLHADVDEGADLRPVGADDLEEGDRRPLMAADLDSGLGDGAAFDPDELDPGPLSAWPAAPDDAGDDEVAGYEPVPEAATVAPADRAGADGDLEAGPDPAVVAWPAPSGTPVVPAPPPDQDDVARWPEAGDDVTPADQGDDDEDDDEEPELHWRDELDTAFEMPAPPLTPSGRRSIMTTDFDDALPPELVDEDEDDGTAAVPVRRQRRPGQPRVPLRARRSPDDAGAADAGKSGATAKATTPAKAGGGKRAVAAKKAAAAPAAKRVSTRRIKSKALWVEPVGGACPTGYPVKARLASGIFHVVGGLFYDRTSPDRCYRDPDAAAADGLRQAKR